ncbi:unnamed protein product [Diatraea saccharalis]|uniref:Uncharacterized protein n=1 Tax=Diatraea saccharalis TaxID=40085 RepID=A0A9P0C5F4_9NEOP|nr:unnamed protein product [Diatraea saccharalis]
MRFSLFSGEIKSTNSSTAIQEENEQSPEIEHKKTKESHKNKDGRGKKKRKGHHRHGKHSKNHKKDSYRSEHGEPTKGRHSKKHTKNKDKDGKKSKQKKKKSKHHEAEPVEEMKRAMSVESLESSNRSRSASPLPSIHTPSPSPTELNQADQADQADQSDQLNDSDFFKDKYDKIKERRRHAAKDAWDSLFDYKQKAMDKQNLHIPEKEKNQKLRETIEKLKAKNEKYKDLKSTLFNSLFTTGHSSSDKTSDSIKEPSLKDPEEKNEEEFTDEDLSEAQNQKGKTLIKKGHKKNTAKNESASEALEQAVKDISKWLDDAPKSSVVSSPCDSPAQTISTEEHDNSRLDDEFSQGEKSSLVRKETSRKRPSSREPKVLKRREIQRTIDRLQPGKGKGNLLTNLTNKNSEKTEEVTPLGPLNKLRDPNKVEESSPKLSLGSVLPTVEFTLGNDHNFANDETKPVTETPKIQTTSSEEPKEDVKKEETPIEKNEEAVIVQPNKKDAEVETDLPTSVKPNQEKATPNLSAWFKAFGTPKSTSTISTVKKKVDEPDSEDKTTDNVNNEIKPVSPKNTVKYDSPTHPDTPNPEGGDSPLPNVSVTPRQRRTSTGSSVSERSSFSQDLDSPRHQMSHTSPLLRSPASPKTDDFQKITYPIINGTVRAGFYQDTTSVKSSPEKSCSPREAPQSPYSPYSQQHVYASNNVLGSTTPNYFVDHNKSPLPTYTQNPPPYYDTSKVPVVNKPARVHEDYTSLGPDSYQHSQYSGPFSPAHSSFSQPQQNYSQQQHATHTTENQITTQPTTTPIIQESKNSLFPVKKRTYNEPEVSTTPPKKIMDVKEALSQNKNDFQKVTQTHHTISSSLPTQSVDDIALALSEKSEIAKLNNLREKSSINYMDRRSTENRDSITFDNEPTHEVKKDISGVDTNKSTSVTKKDNIDMVNMGYMNSELDRRNSSETHEVNYTIARDVTKANLNSHPKGFEVEAIAINLGINNQQMQKSATKTLINPNNIPPAHSQDRAHNEINTNQNIAHAHHTQYDIINSGQTISNFSLNDIELANKKLHYACNTTSSPAALDYGNWKMTNQLRKDLLPSDYPTNYSSNNVDKIKPDIVTSNTNAINYNKNIQQSYNNYNAPRASIQRSTDLQNLPAELRIPNPRGLLKNDHMSIASSSTEHEMISKSIDTHAKSQKPEKLVQNHPLVGSLPYKTPYSAHSAIPLESLRNLPKIPQMLDRYANDERYLSSFAGATSSLYHDKTFQMAQIFNKSISSDIHPTTSVNIYSQPSISINKESSSYNKASNNVTTQGDSKTKTKRKRTTDTKTHMSSQSYHSSPCTDVLSSVKTSIIPGSAFNFGTTTNIALGGGLYSDNAGFTIEDFRNSSAANQLMAANYMAAAVAHQQRNNAESNAEKLVKPAHQNSAHSGSFPFIGHSQARTGYPFVGADTSSPLYQQYLQRHQEELLRQTGAQIMGLYPPGYPASLGVRQPYDSINRPSWL